MILVFIGFALGLFSFYIFFKIKKGGFHYLAKEMLHVAELESEKKRTETALELKELKFNALNEIKALSEKNNTDIAAREEKLHKKEILLEKKLEDFEKKETKLKESLLQQESFTKKVEDTLNSLSSLSKEEAEEILISRAAEEAKIEAHRLSASIIENAREMSENEAKKIIITSLNRLALSCSNEVLTTMIPLNNEEMKRRIIGREGRNIRTFEQEAGVSILVDDIPGFIVISGFDQYRKEIAKNALTMLIQEGKIFPTRIVEVIAIAQEKMKSSILEIGKEAAQSLSLYNLNANLFEYIGKLKFINTNGQSLLQHSLEVAHIMGLFAAEFGLNVQIAKRIGLLHDIGKVVSHEKEGSHATIGAELCQKLGENAKVCHAIASHHSNLEPLTLEEALLFPANVISKERAGARVESLEHYLKRITSLEKLSSDWDGVERAYALHTGKEICVIVKADEMDDQASSLLLKQISQKIEAEYPFLGKIKLTLIREKKFVEYSGAN